MPSQKTRLGKEGEELAALFLRKNGYKILKRNFKNKLGEIDIIARAHDTICFVEVKMRTSDTFGDPLLAISPSKQLKLSRVALTYLKANHLMQAPARFDIVSILQDETGRDQVKVLKNAFDLSSPYAY